MTSLYTPLSVVSGEIVTCMRKRMTNHANGGLSESRTPTPERRYGMSEEWSYVVVVNALVDEADEEVVSFDDARRPGGAEPGAHRRQGHVAVDVHRLELLPQGGGLGCVALHEGWPGLAQIGLARLPAVTALASVVAATSTTSVSMVAATSHSSAPATAFLVTGTASAPATAFLVAATASAPAAAFLVATGTSATTAPITASVVTASTS
jgi:hypothetical protein